MRKTRVKEILTQYRKNLDWLSLYEETSSTGASFVSGSNGDGMITGSQPEDDCMRRQDKREEYEGKREFNNRVEKALNKLPTMQQEIIEHKYNIIEDMAYRQYEIGTVPDVEIAAWEKMPERRTVAKKRNQAISKLQEYFEALNLEEIKEKV